jgi:hypothetical protein
MKKKVLLLLGGFLAINILKNKTMSSKYPLLWGVILKGESKTFNDYNYYKRIGGASKLFGKLNAVNTLPFSNKKLTEMTLGEVIAFQAESRDGKGQLWATGRFQIIPSTLLGLVKKLNLSYNTLYSVNTQYRLADELVNERRTLRQYLNGELSDSEANLQKATIDVAKVWSSVGVPYAMMGAKQMLQKDQSYYQGGGDKASVDSASVMTILRQQRKSLGN